MKGWISISEKEFAEIKELVAIVGRLVALVLTRDMDIQKDKILLLNRLGMSNSEIARVLDTSTNNVAVTISQAKS